MNDGPVMKRFLIAISAAAIVLMSLFARPDTLCAGSRVTAGVTLLRNSEYADAFLQGIRDSRTSIVCSFYLFKTGERGGNEPRRIAEELIRARRRGVAVTVILERSGRDADPLNEDNLYTTSLLTRGGVRVRFDSPSTTSHSKVAVIDSRHIYLGSHNLTQAALRHNNEMSVLIDSPAMASEVLSSLEAE